MKINLPVKLLYPALAAAALLSAAAGLFAASYNSYTQCRCSQPNEPGTNYSLTTCCADQYYKAANPTKCQTSCTWQWIQNTRVNKTQYCASQTPTSCYIEGSVTYSLANRPACTAASHSTTNWNVPGGPCSGGLDGSGTLKCNGQTPAVAVAGWEDPYVCQCV